MAYPRPPRIPNPQIGAEKAPFQISDNQLEIDKNASRAQLESDAMNNRAAFAKAQMSERTSSTTCDDLFLSRIVLGKGHYGQMDIHY